MCYDLCMPLTDIHLNPPKRLAHLPLVMDVLRRSRVVEVIDEACGTDRRMKVSHGECVAMVIAGVFVGESGLWRLGERLDVFDMATVMQDPGINLSEYHDNRIGRALDAIYDAGPDRIQTALALQAIDSWKLNRSYLHVDTTSLSFYGAYEEELEDDWSPEVNGLPPVDDIPQRKPRTNASQCEPGHDHRDGDGRESPKVVQGYAKNHRHDLKQILYGSVVTRDGGVPLYGRAMDGNTSDITAATEFLEHLRKTMTSEPESCFVADSKGWAPTALVQVHDHHLRLLSRLPRSTNLSKECVAAFDESAAQCLLDKYNMKRGHWSWVAYQGADADYVFEHERAIKDDNGNEQSITEKVVLPVRVVTCYSSKLFRQKVRTLKRVRNKELKEKAKVIRKIESKQWKCRADAQNAIDALQDRQPFVTLKLGAEIEERTVAGKRTKRGRPRADEAPPPSQTVYHLKVTTEEVSASDHEERLKKASTYVLVRNRMPGWEITDEEMTAAYGQQWRVEHGFAWLKSGAAINPMYLESPRRIAALCMIYHIALMIHTVIQRGVRHGLKKQGCKLPYHRNKPSDNITAKFTYELFRNVTTQTITDGCETEKRIYGLDEHTEKAVVALGLSTNAYHPVIHELEN